MKNSSHLRSLSKKVIFLLSFSILLSLIGCGNLTKQIRGPTYANNPNNPTNPNENPGPTPTMSPPNNPVRLGPAPVSLSSNGGELNPADLSSAGNYVILTGISNASGSQIVGNMGVSPVAATYITGFPLVADSTNVFSTSANVTGKIYAADYAVPTPNNLTTAIGSMETAYNDAAGRVNPDYTELGAGNIGGLTLVPGLYKWSSSVIIPQDVAITGGANDVWIFQIAGDVTMSSAKNIILTGAQPKNVFWQVAGQVTIGTTAHFEGIVLSKTAVTLQTNASMLGRIFAQSMVALDNNNLTQPSLVM